MKLRDFSDLFLNEYQKKTTRKSYYHILTPMCDWIGNRPLTEIKPIDLVAYNNDLQNRGLALATIRKHVKCIKRFFNRALELELITSSPAKAIHAKRLPRNITREKAMTDDELSRILDYFTALSRFRKTGYRGIALVLFLADTGCRIGGASTLKEGDIDFEQNRATVTEKFDKTRPVAFGDATANALRRWLLIRKATEGEFVFSEKGGEILPGNLGQVIYRAAISSGCNRPLGPHSLRHRKGHQFADAHIPPSIAATALGHEDVKITMEHYYPTDWATAEQALKDLSVPEIEKSKIIKLRANH